MNAIREEKSQSGRFAGPRLGVDLGGTTITAILTGNDDSILDQSVVATGSDQRVDTVIRRIANLVLGLCEKNAIGMEEIRCAGIGVPGEVSMTDSCLRSSPILPDWKSVPVAALLQERLGNFWSIENDANAALLGEWQFGVGQGFDSIVLLTIGTGIGGAVLMNGKLVHGLEGSAGEIGHLSVDPRGSTCWCGNRGCLGVVASTTALLEDFRRAEMIPDHVDVDGEQLRKAFLAGNVNAVGSIKRMTENLAIGVRSAICVTAPQTVILAGGIVSGLGREISTMLEECLADICYPAAISKVAIRPASLPGASGALGASIIGYAYEWCE